MNVDVSKASFARTYDIDRVKDVSFLDTCDELIQMFYAHWQSCRRDDVVALKSNMLPEDMIGFLTRIFIVDKEPINGDYRYKLVGGKEVAFRKYNPTDRLVKEGCVGTVSDALTNYDYIFNEKTHLFISCNIFRSEQYLVTDETLFVPVSEQGVDVDYAYALSARKIDMIGNGPHSNTDRLVFDNEEFGLMNSP